MKNFSKLVLAAAVVSAGGLLAWAQDTATKPNVLVDNFTYRTDIGGANAMQIRNYVIKGLQESNRVNVIDISTTELVELEKKRREGGVDADGDMDRLKVMQQQGANALIQGEITSLDVKENVSKEDGHKSYDAVLTYTLKAIDPATGVTIHSDSYKQPNGGPIGIGPLLVLSEATPDQAIMKVSSFVTKDIPSFVDHAFPVRASILEPKDIKKDEIKSAYISVGDDAGVKKGNKFFILVERQVAGRISQSQIGEMEVEAVEGADISVAKVKKGGKELKQALDAGQTVVLKTKPQGRRVPVG